LSSAGMRYATGAPQVLQCLKLRGSNMRFSVSPTLGSAAAQARVGAVVAWHDFVGLVPSQRRYRRVPTPSARSQDGRMTRGTVQLLPLFGGLQGAHRTGAERA